MSQSMREKIAQVLSARDGMHPDATTDIHDGDEQTPVWHLYLDDADAVLDALMEPTEGMIAKGGAVTYPDGWVNVEITEGNAEAVFVTMIRAAKEGK